MMPASVKRLMLEEKGGKSFKTEFAVVNKCNRVKERGGSHTSSFPVPLRSKRHHQFRQLRFLYCNGIKTRRIQDILIELYLTIFKAQQRTKFSTYRYQNLRRMPWAFISSNRIDSEVIDLGGSRRA